jgi:hypothetical protein
MTDNTVALAIVTLFAICIVLCLAMIAMGSKSK